jgi:hypothetical protein
MSTHSFKVGDIVTYTVGSDLRRTVRVIGVGTEVGHSVFDGELLDFEGKPTGKTVWGYEDQIVSVRPGKPVGPGPNALAKYRYN